MADDILRQQHALGAAEAAEGGVADGVGADDAAVDADMRHVEGVEGVGDGAEDDAGGEVEGVAAIGDHEGVEGQQAARVVEAGLPAVEEGVALAGGGHVGLAGKAELDRRPVRWAARAAAAPTQEALLSLPPKPPPMRRVWTVMRL